MKEKYPHLNDTVYPDASNIDVYKYENTYDYSKFDNEQMRIVICSVPWDVGLVHVGNAQIGGLGNVVKFDSDEERDAWFAGLKLAETPEQAATGEYDGFAFTTRYREFHADGVIKAPIPYDVAAYFNYVYIEYSPMDIDFEGAGIRRWFYFIREFKMLAPNTTQLTILRDTWQTYINNVHIPYMVLERGHAPMSMVSADEYLDNPIENNEWLLAPDVEFGSIEKVTHTDEIILNDGDMYAVFVTSANLNADWGDPDDNTWRTPSHTTALINGAPTYNAFAIAAGDLTAFLSNIDGVYRYRQFKQTVQCVFFASGKMLSIGSSYKFNGFDCYPVGSNEREFDFDKLTRYQFDYPDEYADLAKLYTYPYAAIEISDADGKSSIIKIEDTNGRISVNAALNMTFPFINIRAHLLGVGGYKSSITFRNVTSKTFSFGGRWYEYLHKWDIPTFAIIQNGRVYNDYATHYDREQQKVAYTNSYDSAIASASTSQSNSKRSNAAVKNNADASADTLVSNTALQVAANASITSRSNSAAGEDTLAQNTLMGQLNTFENGFITDTANNQVQAEYASAAIGAAGGAVSSIASGAMGGMAMGPAGAAAGALGGLVSGAISGATSMAQTTVAANLTSAQAGAATGLNSAKNSATQLNGIVRTGLQSSANTDNTSSANSAASGAAANTAANMKANATRTRNAGDSNADADYSTAAANAARARNTAQNAITNQVMQAGLDAPAVFGDLSNGDNATTKPIGLFYNVVTQNKDSIARTGDEFRRWGYNVNRNWKFDGFNKMTYFTFWKVSDMWVSGLNVPDAYMDEIRFYLLGGVTVWRKPEYIGNVSIYDNEPVREV